MKIGFTELMLVFVVALLVIGPDKLPYYAKKLGAGLKEFRKATQDVTDELRENVVEPLNEAQKPLREALEPFEEIERDVRGTVRDVEKSFTDIGKAEKNEKTGDMQTSDAATEAGPAQANANVSAAEPASDGYVAAAKDLAPDAVPQESFEESDFA